MGDENPAGGYRLRRLDRIGAVGAAVTGIVLLGESASAMRIASLACIVVGIIGLKISAH
jgi:quaternary ammonium compound-resistance protein SugE